MSDKHRLYIALYDRRTDPPSFHYGFLLSPKTPGTRNPAVAFHITNHLHVDNLPRQDGSVPWKYRKSTVNPHNSSSFVAKILVAKFPASQDLGYWGDIIDSILGDIPLVGKIRCRTWTLEGLSALASQGGEHFNSIPRHLTSGQIIERMLKVGTEGRIRQMKGGFQNFTPVESDLRA